MTFNNILICVISLKGNVLLPVYGLAIMSKHFKEIKFRPHPSFAYAAIKCKLATTYNLHTEPHKATTCLVGLSISYWSVQKD